MSGPMGGYGKHGSQAVQLALDEINAKGGILGRKVEAIFEDDKMKPEVGVEIFNKFIKKDKVDFVMGPTSSAIAVALADLALQAKEDPDPHSGSGQLPDGCQVQSLRVQHSQQCPDALPGRRVLHGSKGYKKWMNIGPDYAYGRESWASFASKAQGASAGC